MNANEVKTPLAVGIEGVAEMTGTSIRTVRDWVKNGEIPVVKISSRMHRFMVKDVEKFLEDRRVA